jgi:translation initiation factor 2-alpha kinase 4
LAERAALSPQAAGAERDGGAAARSLWEEMQQRESTTRGVDASLLERSISGWGAGGRWGDAVSDVLVGDGGIWEPGVTDNWTAALASTPRGSSVAVQPRASPPAALAAAPAAKPSLPAAGGRPLLREDAGESAHTPSSSHAGAVLEAVAHAKGKRVPDSVDDASLCSTDAAALLARAAALADSTRGVAGLRIKHTASDDGDESEEDEDSDDEDEEDSDDEDEDSDDEAESDESEEEEEEEEAEEASGAGDMRTGGRALRQALLTGHLLALLTAPRGPLPHALPALARELQAAGLLPRWLRDLLMRRPALFDRAFRGTFNANARARAAAAAPSGDPAGRWALTRFWSAHTAGDAAAAGGPQQEAISRYRADFEELSALGRGSFGQVVLGVNRLDGRKYAIKKIALARDVALNSKILREVATLSRLEHASVVRYYQAWTEVSTGDSSSEASRETSGGGGEDEDDEDSSDWRSSSVGRKAPAAAQGKPVGEQRFLYIQMEYCRTTLREVLDSGAPVDVEQAWIWIRQILEGLSHVHAQGITHRDLKPSNLFLDAQGRVRIGDFGLAKFASSTAAGDDGGADDDADGPAPLPPGEGSSTLLPADSEPSGAVGTFLYTAPEVARGLPHDCKVDLYALGVIAFEMLRVFGSGMQRVVELSELRASQRLPAGFAASFPMQTALIESLVQVDPAARPSAAEALQSGALPPRVGDEHLAELLRSLGESGATYDAVVHRVFTGDSAGARAAARGAQLEADVLAAAAATSAAAASSAPPDAALTSAVERVATALRAVFKRHGGEPCFGSRGLGFAPPPAPPGGVHVLDPSGALLGLRDELRGRFVASLAAHAAAGAPPPQLLRRYELAPVVRAAPGAPLPREVLQADFDLVGAAEAPPGVGGAAAGFDSFDSGVAASDAEAMKVSFDVADAVGLSRGATLLVSHRELLSAVWRAAGVPSDARGRAAALLRAAPPPSPPGLAPHAVAAAAAARDAAWLALRRQLLDGLGLAPQVAERLEAIHRVGGEPSAALPRLRGVLRAAAGSRAAAALDALAAATSLLSAMGVAEGVAVAPLLAPAEPYWSGIFFELHAPPRGSASGGSGGAMAVLAAGGRYDALLTAQWPPGADGGPPGGVGVSFSATRLASLLGAPPSSSAALDVLVAARGGGGMLRARLELTSALWAAGVRAETLPHAAPSLTEQFAHATRRAARWLLIISDAAVVRVKHLSGVGRAAGREEDVPRGDIVRHVLALVAVGSSLERGSSGSASAADLGTDIARLHARRSAAAMGDELAAEAEALSDAAEDSGRKERGGRRRRFAPNAERRDERRDARAFTAD